jgi:hypothetical protein
VDHRFLHGFAAGEGDARVQDNPSGSEAGRP